MKNNFNNLQKGLNFIKKILIINSWKKQIKILWYSCYGKYKLKIYWFKIIKNKRILIRNS